MSIQEIRTTDPRNFPSTANINSVGLGIRLSCYFEYRDGQMIQRSGSNVKNRLFRHPINKASRVVELVSAEPSMHNPKEWLLKFVDYFEPRRVVLMIVDAPPFRRSHTGTLVATK